MDSAHVSHPHIQTKISHVIVTSLFRHFAMLHVVSVCMSVYVSS